MSLSLQEYIRKSREAVAANRAKGNKHAELLSRLYSDPYRFLDEILQNTEDAYARKFANGGKGLLQFRFSETGLDIIHDGIDFDEDDLKAITTFAGTTKDRHDEINQIGKFGIGFRSVYALTDHPEIHCAPWHFRIDDYEVLEEVEPVLPPAGCGTLIRLPFRESDAKHIRKWVREGLDRLNAYSILFLKYIDTVEIFIQGKLRRRLTAANQLLSPTVTKRIILDKSNTEKHAEYLLLNYVSERQWDACAVAFRLSENDNGKVQIVRDDNPYLFVYFPTRQESHLGFLVHARFTTTPTREAVPLDPEKTPENLQLLSRAASLLTQSMVSLRNLGFVNAAFFEVLPLIPLSGANNVVFALFHQELMRALQQKKIIPVQSGNHGSAPEVACASETAIIALLDAEALQLFYQRSLWLHSDFNSLPTISRALINLCGIKEVDSGSVAFRISLQPDFLSRQPLKWYKLLYAFLATHPALWDGFHKHEIYSLRFQPVIRLKSGENCPAYDKNDDPLVFLPSGKRTAMTDIHPDLLKDEPSMNFFIMFGIGQRSPDRQTSLETEWVCESGVQTVADEIDLQVFKSEKIDLKLPDGNSLLSGMSVLGDLVRYADPFREMLLWSAECARILLRKKFPSAKCSEVIPDQARLKLMMNGVERVVYIACRAPRQHRYQIPAGDWTAMCTEGQEGSLLLLISDAGTINATALMLENPSQLIKKGHVISDPLGFNLLDV